MFIVFNEELKNEYLSYLNNIGSQSVIKKVYNPLFKASEKYETKLTKDISEFSGDELNIFFSKEYKCLSKKTLLIKVSCVRRYAKWCKDNGLPVSDECVNFTIDVIDSLKDTGNAYIKSPRDLAIKIGTNVPLTYDTKDRILVKVRAAIWLVYAGMRQHDVINIKRENIYIKEKFIKYKDKYYEIYPEMTEDIMRAYNIDSKACNGKDYFIRRANSNPFTISSLMIYLSEQQKTLMKGDFKLTFEKVRMSGLYYRTYQREQLGCPADFSDEIVYRMEQSNRKSKDEKMSYIQIKSCIKKGYQDYLKLWQ